MKYIETRIVGFVFILTAHRNVKGHSRKRTTVGIDLTNGRATVSDSDNGPKAPVMARADQPIVPLGKDRAIFVSPAGLRCLSQSPGVFHSLKLLLDEHRPTRRYRRQYLLDFGTRRTTVEECRQRPERIVQRSAVDDRHAGDTRATRGRKVHPPSLAGLSGGRRTSHSRRLLDTGTRSDGIGSPQDAPVGMRRSSHKQNRESDYRSGGWNHRIQPSPKS